MNDAIIEINGAIDSYGWQRSNVKYQLNRLKGKKVRCKVNSMGGSVNDALAISKLFEDHGDVTVEFVGFCASAVTWMAFGAQSIEMHEDSLWLCHKCSIFLNLYGQANSTKIEDLIKQLENEKKNTDAIDLIVAKKYVDRCLAKGKTLKDIQDLMNKERWLTVDECLEWGFIDKKIPGINKVTDEYRNMVIMNCADMHLPVPEFHTPENKDENSLVDKILDGVRTIFAPKNNVITNSNSITMNKTFVAVNTLLAIEGLAENNGKLELTTEQLQTINEAIQTGIENKKLVEDAVTALDSLSDNVKNISGLDNKINAIKTVINFIPAGTPVNQTGAAGAAEKEDPYKDSKVDPVNDFFKKD